MKTTLKFNSKKLIYKNSTNTCTFDAKKCEAFSYSHWQFLKKIKGTVYFNNYRYSVTTAAHQRATYDLITQLGIKVTVIATPHSFTDLDVREYAKLRGSVWMRR